jgi:hypothetical protein
MDKVVQAFDPETGQVYKNEHGQPKVQVPVGWPNSEGLKATMISFFGQNI